MKISSPFDSFGVFAGPWFFMDLGLKFIRSWQEACYSRLKLDIAMNPFKLPGLPVAAAASVTRPSGERAALESWIAARQGRELPRLGCLTGVRVVGGPEAKAGEVSPLDLPKEVAKAERPGKSARAVGAAGGVAARAPAKAIPKPSAGEKLDAKPAAGDDEELPVAPSVTSMLAMQARSLSKAVARAPKVEQAAKAGPAKKPAAKKPAAASAAKPASKPVAKGAAKAAPAKAVKPAAKPVVKKSAPARATSKKA